METVKIKSVNWNYSAEIHQIRRGKVRQVYHNIHHAFTEEKTVKNIPHIFRND